MFFFFFFQAEDGIRDLYVTGVQTCALPICAAGKATVAAVRPTCASAATNSRIAFWLPGVVEAKGHSTTTAAKATAVEDGVAATSAEPGIKVGTPTAVPTIRAVKAELVVRKAVVERAE